MKCSECGHKCHLKNFKKKIMSVYSGSDFKHPETWKHKTKCMGAEHKDSKVFRRIP